MMDRQTDGWTDESRPDCPKDKSKARGRKTSSTDFLSPPPPPGVFFTFSFSITAKPFVTPWQNPAKIYTDYLLSLYYLSFRALRAVSGLYDTFLLLLLLPAAELCLLDKTPHYSLYLQQLEEIKANMNVRVQLCRAVMGHYMVTGWAAVKRETGQCL